MRKYVFIILMFFTFLGHNTAQEGIIAIARYGQNEPSKFQFNDSLTEFSGGFTAFKSLFLKEFKVPQSALRTAKAPDGMVGFTVNLVGKIVDIEIIDSVTTEIDAEVVRVLTAISEFHPQSKPLKFAIQYNVYPDWFRNFIQEEEEETRQRLLAAKTDSLLKSIAEKDLIKYVDDSKAYFSADIWAGFTTMNDPLSKYLKSGFVLGFDLGVYKRKWFFGANLQLRSTKTRQEFAYKAAYWEKDTSVSLPTMGVTIGYKVIDEDRLAFTPYISIGGSAMSLPSIENEPSVEGATIGSFTPSFGFLVEYKRKVKAKRFFWEGTKLNTSTVQLRLGINPTNFHDKIRGNVVDVGIGLGFSQRNLKL